jgi:octaprenyl-diphosphate synthase
MTEGELQSFGRNAERFTQEDCIRLAQEKTATLFAATCTAPTHIIGALYREPLHQYGLSLGVAFQLIDDILDITQHQAALGKPSCGDIVEGKKTLPILFMREALAAEERDRLHQMIGRAIGDQDRAWAAQAIESSGARLRTETIARQFADQARAALDPLPPSAYKDSMLGLAEFVLIRDS